MRNGFPIGDGDSLGARSLAELAVHRLRAEILSGALAPGERLVEEHLTRRFGTSRAPLREALRLLGEQGLVEHLPRRGVRVTELSAQDMDELFSLRDVLERFAISTALAGNRPPPPHRMAELAASLAEMEAATRDGDPLGRAEAHRRFHLALVALAGHQHLLRVYQPVIVKLQLCMATNLAREAAQSSPLDSLHRHRRLHDAVVAGDLELVLETLSGHGARSFLTPAATSTE
ncbi:MAG: GntR family transcriptional regulator [Actinomycetota bacterium]|nr:GntR family transcriptional regulator [Actinomycetota bacterium]